MNGENDTALCPAGTAEALGEADTYLPLPVAFAGTYFDSRGVTFTGTYFEGRAAGLTETYFDMAGSFSRRAAHCGPRESLLQNPFGR